MRHALRSADGMAAPRTWWGRLGAAGMAFFLLKGLMWIPLPAVLYLVQLE